MFGFAKNQFGAHCGYSEKELEEKNFAFYSLRHLYKTMLKRSNIKDDIIEYFCGHAVNVHNMDENYNNREDLDDIFFEDNGLKVIEYINGMFKASRSKYESFPFDYKHIKQVSLTDNKKKVNTYHTEVLINMDFEDETYGYLTDLMGKGLLPETDDNKELKKGLDNLLENEKIDKRRYDDCIDFIKNITSYKV
jgi:hypothetical protein